MHPILRTARPKQWLKNVLVFAAPGAAGVLDDPGDLGRTLAAFVAFCLAASGTYFWNDVLDVEADRRHPTKSQRPIAAGTVSIRFAGFFGSLLLALGMGTAMLTGRWQPVVVIAIYVAVTLTYSAVWKHIAVLDLIAISAGFVLRAAAGSEAVDVRMSSWFVLVTTFGSIFVVTGKRSAELRELGAGAGSVRTTLDDYSPEFLRFVLGVTCAGALVSYCVWAFETKEIARPDLPWYELSVVPVVTAFLRYALMLDRGAGSAPEELFARDPVLLALGAFWAVVFGLAVYS
jgi:decaprenyl-phosphate phosphoribosyltransferase